MGAERGGGRAGRDHPLRGLCARAPRGGGAGLRGPPRLVGGGARRVLGQRLGLLWGRRAGEGRHRPRGRGPNAGCALVSGSPAQLRREPPPAPRRRPRHRLPGRGPLHGRRPHRRPGHLLAPAPRPRLARRAGVPGGRGRPRGPGRGLPPEPPRDGHRDARRDQPRSGVVLVLARLRGAGGARPLRADRAEGVHRRGRLPLQRRRDRLARADPRGPRRRPERRARRHRAVPPPGARPPAGPGRDHLGRADPRPPRPRDRIRAGRRSTTRSTSCTRPGTTGAPKCIVHGTGGTLLQHLKEHRLHADVRTAATPSSTSPPAGG